MKKLENIDIIKILIFAELKQFNNDLFLLIPTFNNMIENIQHT